MNKKIENKKETIIKQNKKGKAKWLEGRLKKNTETIESIQNVVRH